MKRNNPTNHSAHLSGGISLALLFAVCLLATLAVPRGAFAAEKASVPDLSYTLFARDGSSSAAVAGIADNDGAADNNETVKNETPAAVALVDGFDQLDSTDRQVPDTDGTAFTELLFEGANAAEVEYRVKSADSEWGAWTQGGNRAKAEKPISAVEIKLTGDLSKSYSILYRAHVAGDGWLGWTANGGDAGCAVDGSVVDGIDVALMPTASQSLLNWLSSQELTSYLGENGAPSQQRDAAKAEDAVGSSEGQTSAGEAVRNGAVSQNVSDPSVTLQSDEPGVSYQSHVQDIGWQGWVSNGATSGTTGRSLRVEALALELEGASGGIEYRTHVQDIGWQDWIHDGGVSGTTGRSLRVEALEIKLTGDAANKYDVYYRTHVQDIGWTSWSKNGETSGTTGRCLRVEAIQVRLVAKGGDAPSNDSGSDGLAPQTYEKPSLSYQAHVRNTGWQDAVADGATAGTTGQALNVEGLKFNLSGSNGGIEYRAHVQDIGWQDWVSNGALAGTTGRGLGIEAVQLRLIGDAASRYDVYYRVHVSDVGWMTWTKNGAIAGTTGFSHQIEAIQAIVVTKGAPMPSNEGAAVSYSAVTWPNVSYSSNVVATNWQGAVSNGATSGIPGESTICQFEASLDCPAAFGGISYRITTDGSTWTSGAANGSVAGSGTYNLKGVRIKLTGDVANYCDVWYRVYVTNLGWLDWTRNDAYAGTSLSSYVVEGVQVVLTHKGAAAPGSTRRAFAAATRLNGIDIASYQAGIDVRNVDADFVFIKATEGTSYKNVSSKGNNYKTWANQALSSGKLVGFYHYAAGGNAIAEADYFCDAVKDYQGKAVLALDWEGVGNGLFESGVDVQWCKTFLDRVASRTGTRPLLYMSKGVTRSYNWSSVAKDYPLWAAQYPNYNRTGYQSNPWTDGHSFGAWASPTIYQYTSVGRIGGYGADLDLDLFYGTTEDWLALE